MGGFVGVDLFYQDDISRPGVLVVQMQDGTQGEIPLDGSEFSSTLNVFTPTAVGDGVADDTLLLQAAIDAAIEVGGVVQLVAGKHYRITSPLIIAVPNSFVNVTLRSVQAPYLTFATNARISVDYDDGPALVIQGSRHVRIENIEFVGTNSFVANTSDMWDTSVFLVSGSIRDNRYSPQAAIVLDPFINGAPAGSASNMYPALTAYYTSEYDQASAGQTEIVGCHFRQWNICILNSPSGTLLGGDGLTMRDCLFDTCQWGYVPCQAQTKGCVLDACTFTNIRSPINCVSYGQRQGFPPMWLGGSVGACRELMVVGEGYGPITVIGLFCETTLSIGNLGSNFGSGGPAATWIGCDLALYYDDAYDSVDLHLITFRPTIFIGGSIGFNSGNGTFRVHNGAHITFDSVAFLATAPNDHLPIDLQTPSDAVFRKCQTFHSTPNQDGEGVLATLSLASGGTATLSRVSDGVATFTLVGAGAELEVGDLIRRTTTGYTPALEDPTATPFTTATSLGTVTAIAGDVITLGQVPFTVEASLPLAGIGYTRRRITFDRYSTQITASAGIVLPYPQTINNGAGSAGLAFDAFGEWVTGNSGAPLVLAGSDVYLQEDGTVYLNVRSGRIAIGQNTIAADASALLELESTTQGFLPPRMTELQRDGISSPAAGLIVYNTASGRHSGRGASSWYTIGFEQQASIVSLTDSTGGTANNTVENVPAATGDAGGAATVSAAADVATVASVNTALAAVENNFADVAAKINEILAALDGAGITL